MIILDENILDGQRLLLEGWRLAARQIGVDLGRKGLKDEEIVLLLRQQRYPTLFTRDAGFYHPNLRHRRERCQETWETAHCRPERGLGIAQHVFDDPNALSEQDRIEGGEQRWQTLGLVGGVLLLLVAHTAQIEGQGRNHPHHLGAPCRQEGERAI